mmetsp:Transcript_17495/g.46610  ORF Transcript_17495/g.46610 Transcript_17495/m.46610 type:complete len:266 (+) Transcript_17495:485-1282(+)
MLLAGLLCIVRTVEVVTRDGALGPGHVAPDDEVRGPEVLPDDHVLNGLARAGHLHAVRQVRPPEHGVLLLRLLAQRLVGVDADNAIDVARLRGAASRMHQERGVRDIALGALQELEVSPVDGVPVLEGHHILALRKRLAHLSRGLHEVLELRAGETMQPASNVEAALLGDEGVHRWVLEARSAVDLLGFNDLVRLPDRTGIENRHILAPPAQQKFVTRLEAFDVGQIQSHGQTEELFLRQAHVLHHGVVGGLVHEATQRTEGAVD